MRHSDRRGFLRTMSTAGAAVIATGGTVSAQTTTATDAGVRHRELGRTGWKVTEVSFGAMNMRDPELVQAAIDRGMNYIDTAHAYMNGVNEEVIGSVMATRRDKVFLTTKVRMAETDAMMSDLEGSLVRLKTDHVDLLLLHGARDAGPLNDERYHAFYDTARARGMVRFAGVSTHSNQTEVVEAATASGKWDALLVSYNYTSPPDLTAAIKKARAAGIAIIAMKTQARGKGWPDHPYGDGVSAQQAALRWVLENEAVDCAVPGVTAFDQLMENAAVMGMKLTHDWGRGARFAVRPSENSCGGVAGCTGCLDQCPKGVCPADINRCVGYAEDYHDERLAWENYRALPRSARLDACGDCDECLVKCVRGIDLTSAMRRARELFA